VFSTEFSDFLGRFGLIFMRSFRQGKFHNAQGSTLLLALTATALEGFKSKIPRLFQFQSSVKISKFACKHQLPSNA